MYCINCGSEIPQNSKFCMNCGTKISVTNNRDSTCLVEKNESLFIEREGIRICLNRILELEFIINRLNSKIDDLSKKIENDKSWISYKEYEHGNFFNAGSTFIFSLRDSNNNEKYPINSETGGFIFRYIDDCFWFALVFYAYYYDLYNLNKYWLWFKLDEENLKWFTKEVEKIGWVSIHDTDSFWNKHDSDDKRRSKIFQNALSARKLFLNDFEDYKNVYKEITETQSKEIKKDETILTSLKKELQTAERYRDKLYQLNLVPNKFRNLCSMYYICDFYNSSNEPLSNVFLSLDLDEIKSKLDTIIENQEESIINQAIIISQNATMINQNKQTFDKLCQIEMNSNAIAQNTLNTAQWSKAAAVNTEISAWINAANYLF